MSSPRYGGAAVLLLILLLAGCSQSDSDTAGAASAAPTASQAPASQAPASPPPGSGKDYNQALQQRACYADSFDAANDPLGKAVPCGDAKAGFRLVGIQSGALADCPPNQVLVSEKGSTTDAVAPTLCLEPVTH
jgi:hypothetical protein